VLERKLQNWREWSFAMDWAAGLLLISVTMAYLGHFGSDWESFLQRITGYPFRIEGIDHLRGEAWLIGVILVNSLIGLRLSGFYRIDLKGDLSSIAWRVGRGLLLGSGLAALFYFFFGITSVNRSLLFLYTGLFFVWLVPKEWLFRRYLRHRYLYRRPAAAILIGPPGECRNFAQSLAQTDGAGLNIRQEMDPSWSAYDENPSKRQADLGSDKRMPFGQLRALLSSGGIDLILVTPGVEATAVQEVLQAADEQGVECWVLPPLPANSDRRVEVDNFSGRPVLIWKSTAHYEQKLALKRIFDLSLTLLLLLPTAFLLFIAMIGIRATSKGPLLFRQKRTGWRGRPFTIYKLRTMNLPKPGSCAPPTPVNEIKGPVFKNREDPRVFPFARWLRRFSIDELPQVWNVLRGDMSLVGPRPFPEEETRRFEDFRHHRRHSVLPGMTGLWQVSGRSSIEDFEEWVRLDLEYIDRWSLWLDLKIILRTIPAVLRARGAS
jgi:exopolysaccharide biosynthesis polyprenyl glycosylphosphotransferase